jgi:hypothetical protein
VAPEPFGDGVRDLEECSGRVSEESAARTYCLSGRTWTLLALPVPVGPGRCFRFRGERKEGARKAGWPGFPHSGKERARKKGESGKAGVPSLWEGTGQEERRKREGRGSLAMGGNGPGRKRESRGSLAVGGNEPGRNGESGKAGVPSQWEGTSQEEMGKAGKPGFPRNGRERARKKWRKRESRGSLAMGGNGPGRTGESGKAGVPSQWERTGQEELEKAGKPGFPRNGKERATKKGESGWSARSEAESESVRELDHSRFTHSVGTRSCFGYRQIGIRMSSQRRSFTRCS